jgi:hypothetical protein
MALATGAALLATAPVAANAAAAPSVTASPHKNLNNGQTITVSEKGFSNPSSGAGLTVGECSQAVVKSMNALADCNLGNVGMIPAGKKSTKLTVVSNKSYSDADGNKCDPKTSCLVVVTDNPLAPTVFAAAKITFSNQQATHTKIKGKDSVDKGKKLKLTIKTTHKGAGKLSGKVTITANGKKIAKAKETKSGKVSVKLKFKKTGKEKIVAQYGGDKKFRASSGKKTIKVTKS